MFVSVWCCIVVITLSGLTININGEPGRSCVTPTGESGQCISIYNCSVLFHLWKGRDPQTIRFSRHFCGFDNVHYVCCENQIPTAHPTPNSLLPDNSNCGSYESYRIRDGVLTEANHYPWMALMQYRNNIGDTTFSCGGALINNRYILTAAHCVTGKINQRAGPLVSVRLGEWDTNQNPDCITLVLIRECSDAVRDIDIEGFVVHPDYQDSSVNRYNDIALVRLSQEVKYTEFIRPICLPTLLVPATAGNELWVAGWGHAEYANTASRKLQAAVNVVGNSQCSAIFKKVGISLVDTQFCAGGGQKNDSCKGDSGGPIMSFSKGYTKFYLEGVGSVDARCGLGNWRPGIYTRVSKYLNWIYDNIQP